MTTLVTFSALKDAHQDADGKVLNSEIVRAADLCSESVIQRKKTSILCSTKAQAEDFDELVWQFPSDKFIPHNLYGEGPDMGTPVEVIWQSAYQSMTKLRNTALVINLSQLYIENIGQIRHIIDFVPVQDEEKEKARERYKRYKQAGCQLEYKTA